MQLVHVNTHEKLTVRLYDRKGRTKKSSVRKLRHFLRCHVTGREHAIHWRLLRRLYSVSRHYPGKTIKVYSGYRARRVASSRTSRHVRGMAIDFHVDGVSNRRLRDYLMRTYKPCGVGYYPHDPFVHFDVRKKSAFWVDYSGKGEPANYAKDPYAVLRKERQGQKAAKTKPAVARRLSAGAVPAAPALPGDRKQAVPAKELAATAAQGAEPAAARPANEPASAERSTPAVQPPLPVIQPEIAPLPTIEPPPRGPAAAQSQVSFGRGSVRSRAGAGHFSSASRPLDSRRLNIAP